MPRFERGAAALGLGAAGPGARGERLYRDFTMGGLSMAAFRFAN